MMRQRTALYALLVLLFAPAAFAQDPDTDSEPTGGEPVEVVIEADDEESDESDADTVEVEVQVEVEESEQETITEFSLEEYQRMSQEMEQIDVERMTASSGSDEYMDATLRALEIRSEMVRYLSQWMSNGMPDEYRGMAEQTRSLLSQHLVRLNVELGRCDDASGAAYLIRGMASSEDAEVRSAYEATMADLESCEQAEAEPDTVVVADEPVEPVVVSVDENVVIEDRGGSNVRRGRRTTGIILTSVGVAALAGGFAIDAANAGTRSDFDDLSGDCSPSTPCSPETQEELEGLQDDIQSARVPTGVLIGVGAASALTGVILWATSGNDGAEQRGVQITDGPGLVGTGLRIRF